MCSARLAAETSRKGKRTGQESERRKKRHEGMETTSVTEQTKRSYQGRYRAEQDTAEQETPCDGLHKQWCRAIQDRAGQDTTGQGGESGGGTGVC